MGEGKFSSPRPHRDEERQIEQAFRQVTGQAPAPQPQQPLYTQEQQIEQAIREVTQQAAAPKTPVQPPVHTPTPVQSPPQQPPVQPPVRPASVQKPEKFDLLPEDVDSFFDRTAPMFEEEPYYDPEPDFLDKMANAFQKAAAYCEKNRKVVMAGACAGALLLILGFLGIFLLGSTSADPNGDRILENVLIADIDVGGMTRNEAISTLKQATGGTYSGLDMIVDLSGVSLRLSPKDTKASLDVKAAVNAAYDYGRTGTKSEQEQAQADAAFKQHIIGVLPYLDLDTDYILETLTAYAEDSGSTLTQTTYGLEGREPELSADKFDENAPTQTLVITMGTPGIGFDVRDVYERVLDAYSLHRFLVEVENVTSTKEPDPVDLEAIYEEFYIEPVDATVNLQNFKTESGSYGYGFDLKQAQKLIDQAQYGEIIRIPMEYIAPDILDDDSFFRDTLGEYRTRATGNDNRNKNMELACEAIHNTVLNPGELLQFSTALNAVKGFRSAPEDTGREDTDLGGVTQVASTLYYAAMVSDLEIVSRTNHSYIPSFSEYGMDATAGLQIRNTTGFPVRIEAALTGGYVKVSIVGTEERDYYIVMDYNLSNTYKPEIEYQDFPFDNKEGYQDGDVIEEGVTGYQVKSYKVKYDTESGREISRDFVTNSDYPAQKQIVARVEPEPTTEPTTVPTEPPTEATQPTEPPKPTETTPPPETEATQPPTVPTTPPTQPPTEPPVTEPVVPATEPQTEPPQAPVSDLPAETAAPTVPAEVPAG
ncbi:MAG: VanW family protein [Oscillospiraceae bacterium]|nr:VanW family protein [Oscillospiraceae bacterium]